MSGAQPAHHSIAGRISGRSFFAGGTQPIRVGEDRRLGEAQRNPGNDHLSGKRKAPRGEGLLGLPGFPGLRFAASGLRGLERYRPFVRMMFAGIVSAAVLLHSSFVPVASLAQFAVYT